MKKLQEVLDYFPITIKEKILQNLNEPLAQILEEIRIRLGKPIVLKIAQELLMIDYIITKTDIEKIFIKICDNSIYSYQKQICEGFITIKGGHRVGLVGTAVLEKNRIININYISSLNFRIAREKIGCSSDIINEVIDFPNNTIFNTLIVSPPGCGKTTMLRDIIRTLSIGISHQFTPHTIGLVDERNEIAAMYNGIPQCDIGPMTDILTNCSKSTGMKMLIRSMSPQIIACDEISSLDDVDAIHSAICSGIKGIFTIHGKSIDDIKNNLQLKNLFTFNLIEKIIILSTQEKGKAESIITL